MHKRSYHPMLVVLFHLQLLDAQVLKQIPYSTRTYWKQLNQEKQFGFEVVEDYLLSNADIKAVYTNKTVFKICRLVCRVHDAFVKTGKLLRERPAQYKKQIAELLVQSVDSICNYVSVDVAARIMNISSDTYYRLRNEFVCVRSRTRRCFRQYPQQLSLREVQVIDNAVNDPANFGLPLSTVFFQLLCAGKLFCALSTFYKYVPKIIREQKQKVTRESLRAAFPFQMLHVDITEIITETGKQKVAFIKDNFSKAILNFAVLPTAASMFIRELFVQTFSVYRIGDCVKHVSIVSDGGSENKGELLVWIAQQLVPEVRKLTSGIDVRSNSMSESIHHTLKNEYRLRFGVPRDVEDLVRRLQDFVHYMNHEKFPIEHYGYSCWEVLHGAVPDRRRFAIQMAEAKVIRLEENRSVSCLKGIGCVKR
jgi:hypothetical protein